MKKFLTVLLALSVVFTYSFSAVGTAFAAETYDDTAAAKAKAASEQEKLATATKDAKAALAYNGYGYLVKIGDSDVADISESAEGRITKAAAEAAIDKIASEVSKAIEDKADEVSKNATYSDEDLADIEAVNKTAAELLQAALLADSCKTALHNQYDIDKKAAEDKINAFNTSGYSNIEYFQKENGAYVELPYDERAYTNGVSEAELAEETKDAAKAALDAISLDDDADAATTAAAIDAVAQAVGLLLATTGEPADFFDVYADTAHAEFVTLADRNAALEKEKQQMIYDMRSYAQDFEEAAETYLKNVINTITNQVNVNKAQERLNALNGQVTTLVESFTSRINDVKIDDYTYPKKAYEELEALDSAFKEAFDKTDAAVGDFDDFDAAIDELGSIDTLIAYAKEYANVLKNTYADRSTELKYDADAIDVVLAATIEKIQSGITTSVGVLNTKANVKAWMDQYADSIAKRSLTLAKQRMDTLNYIDSTYAESNYDDPAYASLNRLDAIRPIIEKAIADVNAATTPKQIRDIQDQLDKDMAKYLTDTECEQVVESNVVDNVLMWFTGTATNNVSFNTLVDRDVDAYFVGKTGYREATVQAIKDNIKFELKVAACSLGKANLGWSDADREAIYNAMVKSYNTAFSAEVAKAKTDAELKVNESAVMTLIAAIGSPVSLNSRDKIEAAQDAYDTYAALPGATPNAISNKSVLDAANSRLKALEKAQILDKVYKLNAKDITVDDKAAIEEAEALNSAYEDYWGEPSGYANDIARAWADYVAAAAQDFINKASQLPDVITTADKAAIDAAQAAYDEIVTQMVAMGYTEEYIEAYLKNTYGNEGTTLYRNILKSKIKLDDSKDQYDKAIITTVESLKITAGSSAVKGAITVRWTVKGDASVADGYQIYRSVKKNSGFGTKPIFTTTKQTYKNTKSLKKGTRYYYKVRAYKVVDDKTYYSDWSNKAYRIAK